MSANWALSDKFEVLEMRIDNAAQYAKITGYLIPDANAVDTGMLALVKTRLFETAYEEWNTFPAAQKTWPHFKVWAKGKVKLKKNTQTVVGQFGYGIMGAKEGINIKKLANNFSTAHNATQQTISSLTAQLQQQAMLLPLLQQ